MRDLSGQEYENALRDVDSEETSDLDTTGIGTIDPNLMWQASQGLEKKSDL